MDKAHIIAEIKRTAAANGGMALGRERFFHETGIKQADWIGRYWVRWGDAIREAGYEPNRLQVRYPEEMLLERYIGLMRELGRFPVNAELLMKERSDETFPSHGTFARLGSKQKLAAKLLEYCALRSGYEDVVTLCDGMVKGTPPVHRSKEADAQFGFVYLIRSGRFIKLAIATPSGGVNANWPFSYQRKQKRFTQSVPTILPALRDTGTSDLRQSGRTVNGSSCRAET